MSQTKIPMYQVDAFSQAVFAGNPAAVCVLDSWLEDSIMQGIAAENNLAETAFMVQKSRGSYDLRWFTPEVEIDLCGHATLASAYIVFRFLEPEISEVFFETASGMLTVKKEASQLLAMDFPARQPEATDLPPDLAAALGGTPVEAWKSRDLLVVYESEAEITSLQPDMEKLKQFKDHLGFITTAKGDSVDFVSRFFAPSVGIPEDPVTGSAHSTLVPFWARRLGRDVLHARQLSRRTGDLYCEYKGDRVIMKGHAALFLTGRIELP